MLISDVLELLTFLFLQACPAHVYYFKHQRQLQNVTICTPHLCGQYLLALIVNTDKKHIESISAVRLIFRVAERSLTVLCCLGSSSGCNQNYNGGVFHLILSDSQSRMQ